MSADILYLKQEGVFDTLEQRVQLCAERNSLEFSAKTMLDINLPEVPETGKTLDAKLIFYSANDPIHIQTETDLRGLRGRSKNAKLVLVYDSIEPLDIREKLDFKDFEAIQTGCDDAYLSKFLLDLLQKSKPKARLPLALVFSKDKKKIEQYLVKERYQVAGDDTLIDPAMLGKYQELKMYPQIIILEGEHATRLGDTVREMFSDAYIGIIAPERQHRAVVSKYFTFIPQDRDEEREIRAFAGSHNKAKATPIERLGKCFILCGPTAAGKSEASFQSVGYELVSIPRHTTRKLRPGEQLGKDLIPMEESTFHAWQRAGKFFQAYKNSDGHWYGIPNEIRNKLKDGTNTLITAIDPEFVSTFTRELKRLGDDVPVPILMFGKQMVLENRLFNRPSTDEEKEIRRAKIKTQLDAYQTLTISDNCPFKYGIRTDKASEEEVGRIMKSIYEWEKNKNNSGEDYVQTVIKHVLPADFLVRAKQQALHLDIPDYVLKEYAKRTGIPEGQLKPLQHHPVVLTTEFYGRVGIFLQAIHEMTEVTLREARSHSLGLIKDAIGLPHRKQNTKYSRFKFSSWAGAIHEKERQPRIRFNDGLLYRLGDPFRTQPPVCPRSAVVFGYAQIPGRISGRTPIIEKLPYREYMEHKDATDRITDDGPWPWHDIF
ncbi:MAG TPA: hypothetical protein VLJ21_00805 [Candidatus Binatia bacterium]|nr:hypothetical protein [Candidatus Binatia bacterium]